METETVLFVLTITSTTEITPDEEATFRLGGVYLYVSKDGKTVEDIPKHRWGSEFTKLIENGTVTVEATLKSDEIEPCSVPDQLLGEPVVSFNTNDCTCNSHLFKYGDTKKAIHDATHTPCEFTVK